MSNGFNELAGWLEDLAVATEVRLAGVSEGVITDTITDSQRIVPILTGRLRESIKSTDIDGVRLPIISHKAWYGDESGTSFEGGRELDYAEEVHENDKKPYFQFLHASFLINAYDEYE